MTPKKEIPVTSAIERLRATHQRWTNYDLSMLDEEAEIARALPALLECAEALEAFASEYDQRREHMGHQPDDWPPFPTAYRIMVGDLRRARAALDALAKEVG